MDSTTNCSNQQNEETPSGRGCARGCGFFGTDEKLGLCSKCYNLHLKETTTQAPPISPPPPPLPPSSIEKEINGVGGALASLTISATDRAIDPSPKNRCRLCRRKLGLLGFVCRCGGGFCSMHRHPEAHDCSFDFKEAGKIVIMEQNPICKADKLTYRI